MKPDTLLDLSKSSFRAKVKLYKKRATEIEEYLIKKPNEWGRFQSEFNTKVDDVFRDVMDFEKENLAIGREDKVYKLKKLFINKIRKVFVRGDYTKWSLRKPYGYAGDFKIIEDIYLNEPKTNGFDRLFDNYFQMSAISSAVRNRKNDFKKFLSDFIKEKSDKPLRIMDLASGPCREIKELILENDGLCKNVIFDCYDNDLNSISFAKNVLAGLGNVNFIKENATRIAFRKNIYSLINKKYDFIYSTGLFDYFEERLAIKLISNLKRILNPDGVMIISDVRDKFSNPSVHFMEWVGEWELVYRDDEKFRNIFVQAGFKEQEFSPMYEQQGILQYIKGVNLSS